MIRDRNIVCVASNWWYDPTSKHHIMRLLAETNHVVWVNYHGSRRPRAADAGAVLKKLRQFAAGPRRVGENMTVLTPIVLPLPSSAAARRVNQRLLVRQIRSVLRSLPRRPVQFWSFAPDIDYLCGQFDEECVVYYCVDEFSEFAGYDRQAVLVAERRLAAKADLVVTTSDALYASKRSLQPNTILVPHGVDHSHFVAALSEGAVVADDLQPIPRPILGFWGLIREWVDVDLLAHVARARPEWSFVLIGDAGADVGPLRGLANVHLLGRRPYHRLPAYAAGFDVGLIPFRCNALTQAVNPIKLREYLAAGLPVVATDLPEVRRACSAHEPAPAADASIGLARGANEFIDLCEHALTADTSEKQRARSQSVAHESWESKLAQITRHLAPPPATAPNDRIQSPALGPRRTERGTASRSQPAAVRM